ncbi:hypothetical protein OKW21_000552 [Catalinimonas alkaloidigena]|uniref:hypothetical protein n=1 Tax=Catalinimonas alkaloidigena TaxID=1075417 RepID=UPI002405FE85|nr:hypothetical protein [Catalinimonas alkaloidigena]MDF9795289.1 hypothetical protein [Catalinimonas alkaloidigena]
MTMREHHLDEIKLKLDSLQRQLREDVQKLDDPQARALFETSAEVLKGLHTAFEHYEKKHEAAWEDSEVKVETKQTKAKEQTGSPKTSSPTHG